MCSPIATAIFVVGVSLLHLRPKFNVTRQNEFTAMILVRELYLSLSLSKVIWQNGRFHTDQGIKNCGRGLNKYRVITFLPSSSYIYYVRPGNMSVRFLRSATLGHKGQSGLYLLQGRKLQRLLLLPTVGIYRILLFTHLVRD